ncbi:MAG: hypothetical protein ACT4N8_00165 [Sphingosinicella sp.]|uniref:hypothetical protein n=1 Tax=Sphingosinicella sp. TaxID=1917971 RepID=UPI00403804EE
MRTLPTASMSALALAIAACGEVAPPQNNQVSVPGPEATENSLENLSEGQRNAVFIRAIRDSGQPCEHVESSARAGEHQGLPLWTARCDNEVTWTIVLGNDGSAAVLNPNEAAALGNSAAGNGQ